MEQSPGGGGVRVMKTGADYLESLDDGRTIYLDGQRIADPARHPAFRNAARAIADLYDFQAANPELATFVSPTSGRRVGKCWRLPRSRSDLIDGRKAVEALARTHCGFMGRSPDYMAHSMCGQVMGREIFRRSSEARARALEAYFTAARDDELYLTSAFVNPQADRSKDTAALPRDGDLALAVVDEGPRGIVVHGAKMLGTGCAIANDVLVSNIQPLKPGEERFALSFAQPLGAKGVSILSRTSYERNATSEFDYPLSSHFDENDAVIHFDQVEVPWERLFIYRDVDMCAGQFRDTSAHVYQNYQCQIRLAVKLRFLLGLARRIVEAGGAIGDARARDRLGRLAAFAAMVDGMVRGMEANGKARYGYYVPDERMLYSLQVVTQETYPRFVNAIRELAGGGLIALPSSADDLGRPETAAPLGGARTPSAADPADRVKLMKLAWDALGSEFGSRHVQYEMFYAGAPHIPRGHMYRTFDWADAAGLVDDLLRGYDRAGPPAPGSGSGLSDG